MHSTHNVKFRDYIPITHMSNSITVVLFTFVNNAILDRISCTC
jgi:hypothetical protein